MAVAVTRKSTGRVGMHAQVRIAGVVVHVLPCTYKRVKGRVLGTREATAQRNEQHTLTKIPCNKPMLSHVHGQHMISVPPPYIWEKGNAIEAGGGCVGRKSGVVEALKKTFSLTLLKAQAATADLNTFPNKWF